MFMRLPGAAGARLGTMKFVATGGNVRAETGKIDVAA
jgi:hypothetical protein